MLKKTLLFINGEPPKELPLIDGFQLIACTDGAFHYLKDKKFPLDKLDFISGDFDSHSGMDDKIHKEKFIHTPDQNYTDFHKALNIILEKGGGEVHVYGASGREQDHFLGSIHTAYLFKDKLEIVFFDDYSTYFFIPNDFTVRKVKGKTISLLPFPLAENISTSGLYWELRGESLSLLERVGTRNRAELQDISVKYEKGNLLLFIEK